jgi:squalene-hopene/tetraprenyl-beta-curcumene cyclase
MPRLLRLLVLAGYLAAARATAANPVVPKPPRISPDEPLAKAFSPEKAAAALDGAALHWTRDRQCVTCHTNLPYLVARPALKGESAALAEVRKFVEGRIGEWDRNDMDEGMYRDTDRVVTAATLAISDARTTGKLHPRTREGLDRMWELQQPNGAWNWIKSSYAPLEHDDYYGAAYVALAVGMAPEGYAKTEKAKAGLEKLRRYFANTPAPDLHHRAMLLWASKYTDGLMTETERQTLVKDLLALQRADGGWSLHSLVTWPRRDGSPNDPQAPSDGYGTGFVVFVLRQAGRPATDEAIKRGVQWLRTNQRESGRWFTRSLNTDRTHLISNAGTSFAVLALEACDALHK